MDKRKFQWLFLVYALGCLLPYFVPALNSVNPMLAGIPFTVVTIELWMLCGNLLLNWLSRHVWDPFSTDEEEEGKK